MRKIYSIMAATLFSVTATAQTLNVHFKNGTKIEFTSDQVDYVDFTEKASDPTITAGEYVDLGLSVKWATCNLGANTPYDAGNRYAWGETKTKSSYSESNYAYYSKDTESYTKLGDISGTQFDAATVNLGEGWRMPTKTEMEELKNRCQWEYTKVNNTIGCRITGPNGNSIFIPKISNYAYSENYWTGTEYSQRMATIMYYSAESITIEAGILGHKYEGNFIRPIYSQSSSEGIANIEDYVTVSRTGQGTTMTGSGLYYKVTFSISNSSTETIHLVSLAGVSIDEDLEGGKTYTITLQGSTTYIQNYYQDLIFTYNGKSYTVKG